MNDDGSEEEKRTFPRFPLSSMTFRPHNLEVIFQVDNIFPSGMYIQLKDGSHGLRQGDAVHGPIHWQGDEVQVKAQVIWAKDNQVGLAFDGSQKMDHFFSAKNIARGVKALHLPPFDEERPPHLKCWLKAASVLEVFVWSHGDGEYQKVQILFVDNFIEWQDGKGLQTGKLLGHRDRDTPLFDQEELTIRMDCPPDWDKISPICRILGELPEDKLQQSTKEFILMKFNANK